MTMPGYQSTNTAKHAPSTWPAGSSRLTTLVRALVGYTVEEVERELILTSLDRYRGCRTYTANVLGISIRCLRNKITQYAALGIAVPAPGLRNDLNADRPPPDCVSCGRPMRFAPAIPRHGTSSTFQCRPCGLAVVTAETMGDVLEMAAPSSFPQKNGPCANAKAKFGNHVN
jgi:Bacterial regulatory protein, Fis family